MRAVLREPMLHFVLLGGAIFAAFAWARRENEAPDPRGLRIVITRGHLDQMVTGFSKTWHRPPTREELDRLVEDHIREEVLSREAVAAGLDRDDTIIRRRLRQKMEFLIDDPALYAAPREEELRGFFARHPDRFQVDGLTAFEHVYVDPQNQGGPARAGEILAALSAGGSPDDAGDPFLLPREFGPTSRGEISKMFGDAFAKRLEEIAPGAWTGPVESGLGLHLVRVRERTATRTAAFEDAKDAVRREWLAAKRHEAAEQVFRKLRERYQVVIEPVKP